MDSSSLTGTIERNYGRMVLSLLAAYLLISTFYILFGTVNEDEGWSLYASRAVYEGKWLYSDFSYIHGPVLPYVYGIPQWLFGTSLYIGRFTSLFFGLATLLASIEVARRLAGPLAAVICGAVMVFNVYPIYLFTLSKSYTLTAFFLSLSILFLTSKMSKELRYSATMVLLCLAGGVRLSAMAAVPIFLLYLVLFERSKKYTLLAAGIGAVTTVAIFLPFVIRDPELLWYDLFGFRFASYITSDALAIVESKLRTISSLARYYTFPTVVLASGVMSFIICNRGRIRDTTVRNPLLVYLAGVLLAIFLANFLPSPSLDEYQIIILPVMAILSGYIVSKWYEKSGLSEARVAGLTLVVVLLLVNTVSQLTLVWVDAIDVSGRRLPLRQVSEVASYIEHNTGQDEPIFTYHTYIAVQSSRKVLPGLEMAVMSYYPEWDIAKARRYRVTNNEIAKEYIASKGATAIVLTDYDFTRDAFSVLLDTVDQQKNKKAMIDLIEQHYYLSKKVDRFGQFKDTAYVYLRKPG